LAQSIFAAWGLDRGGYSQGVFRVKTIGRWALTAHR
jgi:hypothetical protein